MYNYIYKKTKINSKQSTYKNNNFYLAIITTTLNGSVVLKGGSGGASISSHPYILGLASTAYTLYPIDGNVAPK